MGTGFLDAVCVTFKRLRTARRTQRCIVVFASLCEVAGERILMKFGIGGHAEDLPTNLHCDLHQTVSSSLQASICRDEKIFRTEIVHIYLF